MKKFTLVRNFLATGLLLTGLIFSAWKLPAAEPALPGTFPLSIGIFDPDSSANRPPYLVMFERGLDKDGRDVRGPLGRLESLRGASKLFPESNLDPGLPVVLRGLRFHCRTNADGTVVGHEVELQGEFNAVRVPLTLEDTRAFISGQRTTFVLNGEKNYGVYAYASSIKMDVQLKGEELLVFKIEADFNFREGLSTYTSQKKLLTPPAGRDYLYRGKITELPNLPSI